MARVLVLAGLAESLVNFRGELLRAMAGAGHEVHVAAPGAAALIAASPLAGIVTAHDLALDRTGSNPLADLASIRSYVRLIRAVKPSHQLAYTIKPVVYGSIAARIARVPQIFSLVTGLGYLFESRTLKARAMRVVLGPLLRAALAANARVFFQNPDNLATFVAAGLIPNDGRAVIVNGSGVDLDRFAPAPLPHRPAVVMIARLLKDKGVVDYAEAARIVRAARPDVPFRLVGWHDAGNPDAVPPALIDGWVADGTIEYLGRQEDVRPAIAGASLYVLPSYHEGTPRTVLEAMAMRRPIVTTDVPGCRETVVDGDNGRLVPAGDPPALAAAILSILADPALAERMADRSLGVAREKYDVHTVNRAMLTVMGLMR